MTKTDKIKYTIIGILAITVIILTVSLFSAGKGSGDNYFKEAMNAKDESIGILKETVKMWDRVYTLSNQREDSLYKRLALLETNLQRSQLIYKSFENRLQNIPARIAAIAGNDDSIRAEFNRFK